MSITSASVAQRKSFRLLIGRSGCQNSPEALTRASSTEEQLGPNEQAPGPNPGRGTQERNTDGVAMPCPHGNSNLRSILD